VGLVALLASLLLAPAPRLLRAAGVVAAAWTYAGLAAWTPSAVRAATLALGVTLAGLLRRPRSAPRGLALALPWLLWGNPEFARALGFQLSAAAVAGILVALDVVGSGPHHRLRFLRGSIVASVGAQLGTLPLQLGSFGAVAPLATLPNLVAIPLAGLFLPAALFAVLLPEGPWTGVLVGASAVVARTIEVVLQGAAEHLPYADHLRPPPSAVVWLMAGGAVAWFTLPRGERRRSRTRGVGAGGVLLLAGLCFLPRSPAPGPWIAFLDVGQGDAAVLRLSDDSTWVIDTGDDRGVGDGARRAVLPFLRRHGIRRVEGLVISHRHRDHVGALSSLLDGIEVERVYDAGYGRRGGTSGRVDSLLAAYRRWPCLVASGDTLHGTGRMHIVALGPPRGDPTGPPPGHNLNDASLVLRVVDGPFRVILAGDAEKVGEAASLAGTEPIRARVLKVGHHGSATSSTEAFLRAVAPTWAVVSCGEGNRFGHPNAGVLARLERIGARVLRTDRAGGVWLRYRDGHWEVRTHPPLPRLVVADPLPSLPSVVGTDTP
jgi:competence protein ComEC